MAVNANRILSASAFIRELWGDAPPRSALTTLQTYIMQLRTGLSEGLGLDRVQVARDILITTQVGYQLRIPPCQLDLEVYRDRVRDGQRAFSVGEYQHAARLLSDALSVWQGPPLIDIHAGPLLQIEVRALEESRLHTVEQLIDARLMLGHHRHVLGELTFLTAQHPMHEHLHAKFMLALYLSGRRSDALEAFRALRTVLIEELGLEPCLQLQTLHQAILAADPELELPISAVALASL
jgi:DNA-binding SARP family transcriptional activator